MNGNGVEDVKAHERYLYTVLNLTKDATRSEINDRHRQLSLIFHPDKQTDDQLKTSATKEFLEIQKAYQVLSDPFLRQVYDTLAFDGLKIQWPANLRLRSKEEIQEILEQTSVNLQKKKLREVFAPKGTVSCSLDASQMFQWKPTRPSLRQVWAGISNTRILGKAISYSAEKKLSNRTKVGFEATSSIQGTDASLVFLGTVRHQFSPRLNSLTTLHLARPYFVRFNIGYDDGNNLVEVKSVLTPTFISRTSLAVAYSRKLFRNQPQRAKVALHLSQQPSLSFIYISPPVIQLDENSGNPRLGPPTPSGLEYVAFDRNFGVVFTNIFPKLTAEFGINLVELATRLKASLEYGLSGVTATLGAHWSSEAAEAGTSVVLNAGAIVLELNFAYLDVQFSLPIVISTVFAPRLALGTVVIPSTAIALGYHFFVLPRRRARRLAYLRAVRKTFEEDSDARKERSAVKSLLKEAVKKQVRIETEREGLIIQEATYGAAETDQSEETSILDVTIPLQALVRNSQLHIPGGDTKAALQGFSDPAPFAPKTLRIRYLFRSRVHYAEIPDHLPVVLPLAEHQVDGSGSR